MSKLSWKEGKYIDLWDFIHFLSGLTLGTFFILLKWPVIYLYGLAFLVIAGWELAEIILKLKEHRENRLLDIVIGMIAFAVGYHLPSQMLLSDSAIKIILIGELFVLVVLELIGWYNYKKYGRGI